MTIADRKPRLVRVVLRVESEAHEVRRSARSVQAAVARAGFMLSDLIMIDDTGNHIRSGDLGSGSLATGQVEARADDLLVVLTSAMLLTDNFIVQGAPVIDASPEDWVFPGLVSELVQGMGSRVWEVRDTTEHSEARRGLVDGVRHPRCLLVLDDNRDASEWGQRIAARRWTASVLDHVAAGHNLRVVGNTMLLCRSEEDLKLVHTPDRSAVLALATHPMFEPELWPSAFSVDPAIDQDASPDLLGRLVSTVRRSRWQTLIERPHARAVRAAIRGAAREWANALHPLPTTLSNNSELVESVTRLNVIDQQVHPMNLQWMVAQVPPASRISDQFSDFLTRFGGRTFTDVFIRSSFDVGGVEVVVLDMARALANCGGESLIVATDVTTSSLDERVKNQRGVELWTPGADPSPASDLDVAHLLSMVLARQPPETVTVCDSERGFSAWLAAESAVAGSVGRLHYQDYSVPSLDGLPYEHVASAPAALASASLVITDSHAHRKLIQETYGTSGEKFAVLPHPVSPVSRTKRSGVTRRVLWAGRMSYEKQPEVAVAAVASLADRGVEMEMWGPMYSVHTADVGLDRMIAEAPNISYMGVYSSVDELDFDRYDLVIIPSIQEGLPHAAIESVFANLFLIVADVGGLPEAVQSSATGTVVKNSAPAAFARAILNFYDDISLHDPDERWRANSPLRNWHSQEAFAREVLRAFRCVS